MVKVVLEGPKSVGAVVLTAGRGRRYGEGKLAARLSGEPILSHVCAAVARAIRVGVIRFGGSSSPPRMAPRRCWPSARDRCRLPTPAPKWGISLSVRLGLEAAAAVTFIDMPGDNPDNDTPADLHLLEDRSR